MQVFKPDKMNGFDVQTESEAMLERQRKDIMPRITSTPRTPATPASGLRFVWPIVTVSNVILLYIVFSNVSSYMLAINNLVQFGLA